MPAIGSARSARVSSKSSVPPYQPSYAGGRFIAPLVSAFTALRIKDAGNLSMCVYGGGGGVMEKSLHRQQKLTNILHYCVDLDIEYRSWNEYWNSFFRMCVDGRRRGGGGGQRRDRYPNGKHLFQQNYVKVWTLKFGQRLSKTCRVDFVLFKLLYVRIALMAINVFNFSSYQVTQN